MKGIDYESLKKEIVYQYGNIDNFSREFGVSPVAMRRRFTGKTEWSRDDMLKMKDLLKMNKRKFTMIFFGL